MCPCSVILLAVRSAALPHVVLFHVDPNRSVHDPDQNYIGMDSAAEPFRSSVFHYWLVSTVT